MTVRSWKECANVLGLSPTHFCGVSLEGSSCVGDSGGPVIIGNQLAGIVSFGSQSCNPNVGVAYTRVFDYVDWINNKIYNSVKVK